MHTSSRVHRGRRLPPGRGHLLRHLGFVWLLSMLVCASLSAEYAVIYRTNGDRYTGIWQDGNAQEHVIQLQDGQRLRIPVRETKYIMFADKAEDLPDARAQEDFVRARQFLELGMKEEAEAAFLNAIHQSPRFADAHYSLAEMLEARGKVEEAMRHYSIAAQIAPQRFQFASRFQAAADKYLQDGEPLKAAEVLLTIAQRFPTDSAAGDAAYRAGFLFAEQYEIQKRQTEMEAPPSGTETAPDTGTLIEKGIQALQQGLADHPEHQDAEQAYYLVGWLSLEKGAYSFAYQQLSQFIEQYPTSTWLAHAYLARGRAALAQRLNQDALEDFERVLPLATDSSVAAEARRLRNESAWQTYSVAEGLPSNLIQAIAADGDMLWVGTPKGLAKFDTTMGGWTPLPLDMQLPSKLNVYALAADDANVWIGTLNNGLYHHNKLLQHTEQFISGERIYDIALFGDEVWIGTFNGLRYYNTATGEWLQYQQGLPALDVVAVTATPNSVWVGTTQNGLGVLDKATRQWRVLSAANGLPKPIGNSIRSLAATTDRVWFTWYTSRANGYGWYDELQGNVWGEEILTGTLDPLEGIFVGIADQQAWIAHNVAVYIRDLVSADWNTIEKPTNLGEVTAMAVGQGGAWIGTTNGLGKVDSMIAARTAEATGGQ